MPNRFGAVVGVPVQCHFTALVGLSRSRATSVNSPLLLAKLASKVRQSFHVELPMVEVFKKPTVADLAEAVVRAERAKDVPELPPIRRVPRDRPSPLSFPQERVWFLDQLTPGGNIAYNFNVTIPLWDLVRGTFWRG